VLAECLVGTAMVYPTLLAAIGDVAHPSWRASSVGVYRLWRDLGYAIGAVLAGVTADVPTRSSRDLDGGLADTREDLRLQRRSSPRSPRSDRASRTPTDPGTMLGDGFLCS
jgi:hypothetical protein